MYVLRKMVKLDRKVIKKKDCLPIAKEAVQLTNQPNY